LAAKIKYKVQVGKKSAIPNTKNCGKVKIKCCKDTGHCRTGKHDVEVADNIKSVMKQGVKTNVGIEHTTQTTQDKEVHKT
jgi:hypothetical protein